MPDDEDKEGDGGGGASPKIGGMMALSTGVSVVFLRGRLLAEMAPADQLAFEELAEEERAVRVGHEVAQVVLDVRPETRFPGGLETVADVVHSQDDRIAQRLVILVDRDVGAHGWLFARIVRESRLKAMALPDRSRRSHASMSSS